MDPDQAQQLLQQQAQQLQQLQAQLQVLQQAAGQPRPERTALSVPKFDGSPSKDFDSFQRTALLASQGNRWTNQQTILAVLHAMTGDAARITARVPSDPAHFHDDLTEFFNTLRLLFVTPAYASQARAEFEARVQKKDEGIRLFHGLLQKTWVNGYMEEEEPWRHNGNAPPAPHQVGDPPGHRSRRLIDKFISGISNTELRIKMRDSITMGIPLDTYPACLERALDFMANMTMNADDNRRVTTGQKYTYKPSVFDATPAQQKGQDAPVPMEIGALNDNPKGKYCEFHKVTTHNTKECKAKAKAAQSSSAKAVPSGATTSQVKCYKCGETGHIKSKCTSAKKPQGVHALEDQDAGETQADQQGWADEIQEN